MRTTAFLLLLLAGMALPAQILDENTQVLAKPRGEAIAELKRGEKIYTYSPDGAGWYKMRKEVYLKLNDLSGKDAPAGTVFRNKDEEEIGKALADIRLKELDTIKGFRSDDRVRAILEGFVFKTKIAANSIPEKVVSDILQIRNRTEQQERFKELWQEYDAEERDFEDLTAYVIREDNKTTAEEKDFRLVVVFRGETTPYAVITNKHTVEAPRIKHEWEEHDFRIIYFYKPTSAQEELMNDILYTFMAL